MPAKERSFFPVTIFHQMIHRENFCGDKIRRKAAARAFLPGEAPLPGDGRSLRDLPAAGAVRPASFDKGGGQASSFPLLCRKGVRLMYITVDQLFDFTLVLLGVAGFVWLIAKAVYKKGK